MTDHSPLTPESMVATPDGFKAKLPIQGRELDIFISLDGCSSESTFGLANQVATQVTLLDDKCQSLIAAEFLASYNEDWRMGETGQPDGSTVPFENPLLEEQEFCKKLALTTIEITGDQTTTLWYNCGDLFWGHSLFVTAFDGITFEDTSAQMFG